MLLLGMAGSMYAEKITVATGFGDEITSLDEISNGEKFVIGDGTNVNYFSGSQDMKSGAVTTTPSDSYFFYTITKIEDDGLSFEDDVYAVNIMNGEGVAFPAPYNLGSNMNITSWGSIFSGSCGAGVAKNYGTDGEFWGLWTITADENGFTFKNVGRGSYLKIGGTQGEVAYLKLYKSIVFDEQEIEDVVKEDNAANADIFALANAEGYDPETGVMTNGGWTFETPVSILDWDYIVITTSNTAADASHEISITDENGVTVSGEGYTGSTAQTGGNMWLDRWNNQNAIRISVDFLRLSKLMDVKKIKSLKINGTISIANVYLTDYNNTKINGGYAAGDVVFNTKTGDFGTICLPYVASYAGAEVYSIAGKNDDGISLEKVTGLLEPGKPYIYKAVDVNGQNNDKSVLNVNFFRADLEKFDVDAAGEDNGLFGTFADIDSEDNLIVKDNKIDQGAVLANTAYIDLDKISGDATEATIEYTADVKDIATAIKSLNKAALNGAIFNVAGQQIKNLQKGINIVDGAKVYVK